MKWIDATRYKEGERDKGASPRVWKSQIDRFDFIILKKTDSPRWYFRSNQLGITTRDLGTTDLREAKANALDYLSKVLNRRITDCQRWLKEVEKEVAKSA